MLFSSVGLSFSPPMNPVRVEMTPSGWRSNCCMIQAQPPARTAVSALSPISISLPPQEHRGYCWASELINRQAPGGRDRVVQHRGSTHHAIPLPREQDPQPLGPAPPRLTADAVESPLRRDPH